jgi:hypothetical protein
LLDAPGDNADLLGSVHEVSVNPGVQAGCVRKVENAADRGHDDEHPDRSGY